MLAVATLLGQVSFSQDRPAAWPPAVEQRVLRRVKAMPVDGLQAGQGNLQLEVWLQQELGRTAKVEWSVGGCDLKPPLPDPHGGPVCVLAEAWASGPLMLKLHVRVGTLEQGETGTPAVFDTSFLSCGDVEHFDAFHVAQVSDVRAGLLELSKRPGCNWRR
jgi:hypothetical protein